MANSRDYRIKRAECERMYLDGKTDASELAAIFSVKPATVEGWIRKYGWKTQEAKQRDIEAEIIRLADEALLVALEEFKKDPANKDLQSLRGMFKEFLERRKPARKFLDYVIKFQEQFKDFCLTKGHLELWETYRQVGQEFSEYLRIHNG